MRVRPPPPASQSVPHTQWGRLGTLYLTIFRRIFATHNRWSIMTSATPKRITTTCQREGLISRSIGRSDRPPKWDNGQLRNTDNGSFGLGERTDPRVIYSPLGRCLESNNMSIKCVGESVGTFLGRILTFNFTALTTSSNAFRLRASLKINQT